MIPSTTDDLIAEIEAAAKGIQGWPNESAFCDGGRWYVGSVDEDENLWPVLTVDTAQYDCEDHAEFVAKYYATANPANVLALLARIAELTAAKATAIAELDADRIYCRERHEAISARLRELEQAQRWVTVSEQLPEPGLLVQVYAPPQPGDWPDMVRIDTDGIDPDSDGYWVGHGEHYEHYCMVAKGGDVNWTGPSEKAPYTHWKPMPEPPK